MARLRKTTFTLGFFVSAFLAARLVQEPYGQPVSEDWLPGVRFLEYTLAVLLLSTGILRIAARKDSPLLPFLFALVTAALVQPEWLERRFSFLELTPGKGLHLGTRTY